MAQTYNFAVIKKSIKKNDTNVLEHQSLTLRILATLF